MRRPQDIKMITLKLVLVAAICGAIVTVWYFEEGPGKQYWGGFSNSSSNSVQVIRGSGGQPSQPTVRPKAPTRRRVPILRR